MIWASHGFLRRNSTHGYNWLNPNTLTLKAAFSEIHNLAKFPRNYLINFNNYFGKQCNAIRANWYVPIDRAFVFTLIWEWCNDISHYIGQVSIEFHSLCDCETEKWDPLQHPGLMMVMVTWQLMDVVSPLSQVVSIQLSINLWWHMSHLTCHLLQHGSQF